MNKKALELVVKKLVEHPKGILAIDESDTTATKRFEALGVESTEENRRLYRQMLITTPGIEQFISGYIMFDETIRQETDGGTNFADFLSKKGVQPGIKVDTGKIQDPDSPEETITQGLDGLEDRLKEYKKMGAVFTKWRAVIQIDEHLPTKNNILKESQALATYAALAQSMGLVPMVEPEILIDGGHSIERSYQVSVDTWAILREELNKAHVYLPGCLLKTSMVISGKDAESRAGIDQVAQYTVKGLKEAVPSTMGGVVFLSGGQTAEESTAHLQAMHALEETLPWPLSFSYGRAIQQPALEIWAKNFADKEKAQHALAFRAKMNSLAVEGKYHSEFERQKPY